jgi:hypothetical protein
MSARRPAHLLGAHASTHDRGDRLGHQVIAG